MNCFYHNDQASIGVCKSCMRGLCKSSASEVKNGIACENRCERIAEKLNDFLDIDIPSKEEVSHSRFLESAVEPYSPSIFNIAIGIPFIYLGVTDETSALIVLGAILIAFGAWSLFRVWKAKKIARGKSDA